MARKKPNEQIKAEIIEGFIRLLKSFDWYYQYADDHRAYKAGRDQEKVLFNYIKDHPTASEALDALYMLFNPDTKLIENELQDQA